MMTLNDVCHVITCGVAKRPEYVEEGVPFLSSKNVKSDRFILDDYNHVSDKDYRALTKHNKPEIDDILYTRVGSFGEAAVINFDFDFAITDKGVNFLLGQGKRLICGFMHFHK